MGKTEKGRMNSLSTTWYLEQMMKLRAKKLSREDANFLKNSKLDLLVPPLRYALVLYFIFDTLFLVEDAVHHRTLARYVARYVITIVFLVLTFALTFKGEYYKRRAFSVLTYITILVQSASTSLYLYYSSESEQPPISPFLPMDIFFLFFFVRIHIGITLLCSVVALLVNEVIAVTAASRTTGLEAASVVLYLICILVGVTTGYIQELNFQAKYFLGKDIAKDRADMASEREKSERLLYNILPRAIADSLKNDFPLLGDKDRENDIIADNFEDTTIAFCDICDFTVISSEMNPEKLVSFLNDIFSSFDNLVHEFGLEKIKTIGDAYMFVGGLSKTPLIQTKHGSYPPAEAVAEMALCMQDAVDVVSKKLDMSIKVRVGINSGSVVAGIVGLSKFVYDLFGETVNMSAKMESSGQPKRVHVSHATYLKLQEKYEFEPAQDVEVKDKFIKTYFLLGRKGNVRTPAVQQAPSTTQNNLIQFLAANPGGPDASADFSPAKPIKPRDENALRPASPVGQMRLDGAGPPVIPTHDSVELLNPAPAAPEVPVIPEGPIYPIRMRTSESDPDLPGAYGGSRMNGRQQPAKKPPAKMPNYPTIFAKSSSQLSLDRAPSKEMVLHARGSFTSSITSLSKHEEGQLDLDPLNVPNLGLRDLLSLSTREQEVRYRKDFFRKYSRVVQFHAFASLAIYVTLGVIDLAVLPSIDYGALLAFGACALVIAAIVFTYFVGDDGRAYMHYLPAAQSALASTGLIALIIIILKRDPGFQHHQLAWDACIIMLTFIFTFSGTPFLHTITVSVPTVIAIIASVAALNQSLVFQTILRLLMLTFVGVVMSYRKEIESRISYYVTSTMDDERRKLVAERSKSEKLLYAILPQKIAAKLRSNETSIADTFYDVTVMFVSLHNFTTLTASLNHFEQVSLLNKIFSKFDKVCEQHKLEKIKTIGATYLVVGGLPMPKANHLTSICEMALDLQEAISQFRAPNGERYKIKAGIHCGKVVAGVIGIYKFSYDLWGDTVNTASRMETHSLPGQIQVTELCQKKLAGKFEFTDRGFIQVKGKGVMHTYFLSRQMKPKLLTSISSERLPGIPAGNFSD